MAADLTPDLCIIGAGSAGLSVAAAAAQLGASTVLVERGAMGGECLNTGCVPSKSLLVAAKAAHGVRRAAAFGIEAGEPEVDYGRVRKHVRDTISAIAPHDSAERFEGLGVRVIRSEARFTGPRQVEAGGLRIRARRVVVATGSRPVVPEVPGLASVSFLTNETVFENEILPEHLVILGGGPIGLEMAQAYARLGAKVTLLQRSRALPRDDVELAGRLVELLRAEGVDVREGVEPRLIAGVGREGIRVAMRTEAGEIAVEGSHLLVAAGRRPSVDALDLAAAGIACSESGIVVDARLRTTARGVYAIGDVTGGPRFTHVASYQAGIVIRNALFRLPARVDYRALPWVTFTDPELAQAGLTEAQARERHGDAVRLVRAALADNDRARTERATAGLVKVVALANGRILGVSILGAQAGELIHLWVLAIARRLKLKHVAGLIVPYPTLGEAGKRAAGEFYRPALFSPWTRRLVRSLALLP